MNKFLGICPLCLKPITNAQEFRTVPKSQDVDEKVVCHAACLVSEGKDINQILMEEYNGQNDLDKIGEAINKQFAELQSIAKRKYQEAMDYGVFYDESGNVKQNEYHPTSSAETRLFIKHVKEVTQTLRSTLTDEQKLILHDMQEAYLHQSVSQWEELYVTGFIHGIMNLMRNDSQIAVSSELVSLILGEDVDPSGD